VAPGTAGELAAETKLTIRAVELALRELVNAGRAQEMDPGRFVIVT
jgi:hypothetical protein